MDQYQETIFLPLSRDEALELFSRCLRSDEDDNEASRSALKKLAEILATLPTASMAA